MYNNELKQRYIEIRENETTLPNNYLLSQFNKLEEYEEELGKDVSNFSTYEILEYYKLCNYQSIESLQCLNGQLSLYTQWCLQENLVKDNQNHFLEMDKDILNSCVNKYALDQQMVSRQTVLQWIYQLPNPKDQFSILALFEFGKNKNFTNIINAEIDKLDDENNLLTLPDGRTVKISSELKHIIYECFETNVYYSITGNATKVTTLSDNGNKILKQYINVKSDSSEFQKSRTFYNGLMRALDYLGIEWCSANSLTVAGKIHMIKTRAQELNMSAHEYIYSDYFDTEVVNQYGVGVAKSVFVIKYQDYL